MLRSLYASQSPHGIWAYWNKEVDWVSQWADIHRMWNIFLVRYEFHNGATEWISILCNLSLCKLSNRFEPISRIFYLTNEGQSYNNAKWVYLIIVFFSPSHDWSFERFDRHLHIWNVFLLCCHASYSFISSLGYQIRWWRTIELILYKQKCCSLLQNHITRLWYCMSMCFHAWAWQAAKWYPWYYSLVTYIYIYIYVCLKWQ